MGDIISKKARKKSQLCVCVYVGCDEKKDWKKEKKKKK